MCTLVLGANIHGINVFPRTNARFSSSGPNYKNDNVDAWPSNERETLSFGYVKKVKIMERSRSRCGK
jgi:hypothetical protein